jgi:hypothetical protein
MAQAALLRDGNPLVLISTWANGCFALSWPSMELDANARDLHQVYQDD